MRFGFVLLLLIWISGNWTIAQHSSDTLRYLTLEEARTQPPELVYALDLSKLKLTEIPEEVFQFIHLEGLILSKNKFSSVPNSISKFTQLKHLYLLKNKLEEFPDEVFELNNLEILSVARNKIRYLPAKIAVLENLRVLDLWGTRILGFPKELAQLENLEELDVRGITYSTKFVESWTNELPNTLIHFENPCTCLD